MAGVATLADIEKLCMGLSRWKVTRRDVDRVLEAVRGYVDAHTCTCAAQSRGGPVAGLSGVQGASRPAQVPVALQEGVQGRVADGPEETARICRVCLRVRPITEFHRTDKGVRGRRTECRDCGNTRKRTARAAKKGA